MSKWLGWIGATVGSAAGGWLGSKISIFAGFVLGVLGLAAGLYIGRRVGSPYE